mgnify:CR=1 FL=1
MRLSFSDMQKEIVVLIGGPSSGKTTLIEALKDKGHTCYPEISREVIREAQEQGIEQLFLEKPLLFSELLLEGRKKQFNEALKETSDIVFLDRGIPDVLAYMHYIGDSYPAFLIKPVMTINTLQYLFYRLGKRFILAMLSVMKITNKLF